MKNLLLILSILAVVSAARAQTSVKVDGSTNALLVPTAEQFYEANPPPGFSIFTGTQASGVHLIWGEVESFAGNSAAVSIQNDTTQNGLDVHTTGTGGIAIIGQSDTGAPAGKFVQTQHFDFPALFVWRNGYTTGSDAPLLDLKSWGAADVMRVETEAGSQTVLDVNAAVHVPHLPDSAAQTDSFYYSTDSGALSYKTTGDVVQTWVTTGSNLTAVPAGALASGRVAPARLGSGTASSTTYLRGDGTWAAPTASVDGQAIQPATVATNVLYSENIQSRYTGQTILSANLVIAKDSFSRGGNLQLTEITPPTAPVSGKTIIYASSTDHKLHALDSTGVDHPLW